MNVNILKTCTLLLSIFTTMAAPVNAINVVDHDTENDEVAIELPVMTTTLTRTETARASLPASISVIDNRTLEKTSSQHIEQLLQTIPGVNLQRGSGQEYLPAIRSPVLTGPGACGSFLMAQDGIPLRAAGFCNLNELFDAHHEAASRVEVVRGPASIAHGSNAVNGAVNVITSPVDSRNRWSLQAGSDEWLRLNGLQQFGMGDTGFAIALTASSDGGFRDHTETEQHKFSVLGHTSLPSVHVRYGLTATRLNQETAGFLVGADSYRDRSMIAENPTPEAYRDANANRAWVTLTDSEATENWQLTAYARDNDMAFLQHFLPGDPLERNSHSSLGLRSQYQWKLASGTSILSGLDVEGTRASLLETQDAPTQGSAFLRETIPTGRHYDYDVDATAIGLFTNLIMTRPEQSWTLRLGARLDYIDYDYQNNMLSGRTRDDGTTCGFGGCRFSRPDDRSDSFTAPTLDIGFSRDISTGHYFYTRLARAFRAPQATELYRLQRNQQVADLNEEKLINLEAGLRGATASTTYDVTVFWQRKTNVILRDSDFFNVSDGKTKHEGIELQLQRALSRHLDLSLAFSYARHQYDNDPFGGDINVTGNDVDTAPRTLGHLALAYQIAPQWATELQWRHVGSYETDPENLHDYPGHDLLNMTVNWRMNRDMSLKLGVNNLTDRRYADRADFSGFVGDRYFPGRPRTAFLEFTWRSTGP